MAYLLRLAFLCLCTSFISFSVSAAISPALTYYDGTGQGAHYPSGSAYCSAERYGWPFNGSACVAPNGFNSRVYTAMSCPPNSVSQGDVCV